MALTVYPQQWQSWMVNELVQTNNMISQGLVTLDTSLVGAEKRVRTPIYKSLSTLSADSVRTAGNTLTTQALTDTSELAVVLQRWDGIYNYGVTTELQGADAIALLKAEIAGKVSLDIQNTLVSYTTGAYVSALSTHLYDATSGGGSSTISYELVSKAGQSVLGETMTNLDKIVMHSKVYNDALINGMITFPLAVGADVATSGRLAQMFGLRVIVNDTLCAGTTANGITSYPCYLVGGSPWSIKWQKNLSYETYRESLSDKNHLIWHYSYAPSIPGTSYTDATDNPTNTNLLTATITKTAENDKNIKLVKLIVTGA